MVTLIRTAISGVGATGGGLSTLAFEDADEPDDVASLVGHVSDFWSQLCANYLHGDVTFQVESTQARYAASTGALQEVYGEDGGPSHTGVVTGAAAPKASQALIRWKTAQIVGNRLLQGRTFIPGIPAGALTAAGELNATYRVGLAGSAAALIDATNSALVVWSRPTSSRPGSTGLVTVASIWNELAVLRSRRD